MASHRPLLPACFCQHLDRERNRVLLECFHTPCGRLFLVLFNTTATAVASGNFSLGIFMSLLCGLQKPPECFSLVLINTVSISVTFGKAVLCPSMALSGCLYKPRDSLLPVFFSISVLIVVKAYLVLSVCDPLLCGLQKPLKCFFRVFINARLY